MQDFILEYGAALGQNSGGDLADAADICRRCDIRYLHSEQLIAAITGNFQRLFVKVDETARFGVGDENGIVGRLEQVAVFRF